MIGTKAVKSLANSFLNLEKTRPSQGLIYTLAKNENEIKDPVEIKLKPRIFINSYSLIISVSNQNLVSFRRFASTKAEGRTSYKM